jgi:hypothetical protein
MYDSIRFLVSADSEFLSALWGRGIDERVDGNFNGACRNAFVFTTGASAFFLVYIATLRAMEAFPLAFSVIFAERVVVFVASFYYNEYGDRGQSL